MGPHLDHRARQWVGDRTGFHAEVEARQGVGIFLGPGQRPDDVEQLFLGQADQRAAQERAQGERIAAIGEDAGQRDEILNFLPPEQEIAVVSAESELPPERVRPLVRLAGRLRALKGHDLEEGVSTRLIVYCATLVAAGVSVADAVFAAMIEPLTDDADVKAALVEVSRAVIG